MPRSTSTREIQRQRTPTESPVGYPTVRWWPRFRMGRRSCSSSFLSEGEGRGAMGEGSAGGSPHDAGWRLPSSADRPKFDRAMADIARERAWAITKAIGALPYTLAREAGESCGVKAPVRAFRTRARVCGSLARGQRSQRTARCASQQRRWSNSRNLWARQGARPTWPATDVGPPGRPRMSCVASRPNPPSS